MLEARYTQAVSRVEKLLGHLNDVRLLSAKELSTYKNEFSIGWEIPGLCDVSDYRHRLLLSKDFPFKPPRVAVTPAPKVLTWPHLENEGILCLLPESATRSIEDIDSVVLDLLERARELVDDNISGKRFDEFEDEFNSYWERWIKTEAHVNILCRPEGPSRWLSAWHDTKGVTIAEDDMTLRCWLQNRYRVSSTEKISPQPVPLLWLARPLRPTEYPTTVGAVFDFLESNDHAKEMLQQLLFNEKITHKTVLLGFVGHRGAGFAGLRIGEPIQHPRSGKALYNGFRNQPPKDVMLMRYRFAPIKGAYTKRYDAAWVHGRDHNQQIELLQRKSIIIFGIGSIGSSIAELMAKSGVGNITLVDPELIQPENTSRHVLGAEAINNNKAIALANSILKRFPHLKIEGIAQTCGKFIHNNQEKLQSADLIISTIGDWGAESQLNAMALESSAVPPILYGWLEPHAAAGHSVALFPKSSCLRCIVDSLGKPRLSVTDWQDQETTLPVPLCGGHFQPYGAIELTHIHALIADLALDVLLHQLTCSTYRVWIGSSKLLGISGGKWSASWVEAYGDPGTGGRLAEIPIHNDTDCPECGGSC